MLLVDLWLLGDDVEELVLDNWDQVTSNALQKLWRSLSLYATLAVAILMVEIENQKSELCFSDISPSKNFCAYLPCNQYV